MTAATMLGAGLVAVVAVGGAVTAGLGVAARRRDAESTLDFLSDFGSGGVSAGGSDYDRRLRESFLSRALSPLVRRLGQRVVSITPVHYTDRVHQRLLLAGLSGTLDSEELISLHVLSIVVGVVLGVGLDLALRPGLPAAIFLLVVLGLIGVIGPNAWLKRVTRQRQDLIRKELPDVLDLLTIAVEAGSGFEGAMAVVCANFTTGLGRELARTLKEMELGLPRREALQNLKRRNEVPELSNFVLALVQADALGMPIGPVLRAQGAEMRTRRRQWARERAAKLPVKMLFPMVLFIFPAIFVVLLGPAASSISHLLKTLK